MRRFLLMFVPVVALAMAGCSAVHVDKIPLATAQPIPTGAKPSPVGYNGLRYGVPTGTTTVGISYRNPWCLMVMRKTEQRLTSREDFPGDDLRTMFKDSLDSEGYDVAGDPGRLFDEEEDEMRAVYAIAGRVKNIKMDTCDEQNIVFLPNYTVGKTGEAMIEIEWTVFDLLHRHNVYKVTTKGYGRLDDPNDQGIALMLEDAFGAAVHNLGADKTFFDLIFSGIQPPKTLDTIIDPDDEGDADNDARTTVEIPPQPALTGDIGRKLEAERDAVVMIEVAGAMGSGFFISPDGLILTDAHVVGNAKQVRIITSGKKQKLIADVVRKDPMRDVALLRLENKPDNMKIFVPPIQRARPHVSDTVYAIGAPEKPSLQDTVTKGIVSAIRYEHRYKQWFIQSDVYVYHGNSGGPLLDGSGNVIGLCEKGTLDGSSMLADLNMFTPIADALDALDIKGGNGAETSAPPPKGAPEDTPDDVK